MSLLDSQQGYKEIEETPQRQEYSNGEQQEDNAVKEDEDGVMRLKISHEEDEFEEYEGEFSPRNPEEEKPEKVQKSEENYDQEFDEQSHRSKEVPAKNKDSDLNVSPK